MQAAEALALRALAWLAEHPDRLGALMARSGVSPAELRRRAADPVFLGFALDWLLEDEGLARAFAEEHGLGPEPLRRARAALPGGDAPDWT